jgi:predicted phosphodiesterase
MRIALVSDIHGNLPALQAVVRDIDRRDVDAVVNLGDALSGPLLPQATAEFLMAQDWEHLAGNHERQVLTLGPGRWGPEDAFTHGQLAPEVLAWMAGLQPARRYSRDIYLCHATPANDLDYLLETVEPTGAVRAANAAELQARIGAIDAAVVACGHTHHPRVLRTAAGQLLVNPGSVGLQAYEWDRPFPHRIENGAPDAHYAIVERAHGQWQAQLLAVPYDHESMALLAQARGMADWVHALRTGTMG